MRQPAFPSVKSAGAPLARDARIAAFAARQHAAVTIEQLRAAGLTDGGVVRRVRRGALYRWYRGVYVVGQPTLYEDGERMAAVLAAGPDAAPSHVALAELRGIVEGRQVDFHWPEHRLVVEIDGARHGRDPTRLEDSRRDASLRGSGWTVLRFPRAVVLGRPAEVRDSTLRAFRSSSHPHPRLEGDGTKAARAERAPGDDARARGDRAR